MKTNDELIFEVMKDIDFANYLDFVTEDDILKISDLKEYHVLFDRCKSFNDDLLLNRIETCSSIVAMVMKEYTERGDSDYMALYKYTYLILSIFSWEIDVISSLYSAPEEDLKTMWHLLINVIMNILVYYKERKYDEIINKTSLFMEDMMKHIAKVNNSGIISDYVVYRADPKYGVTIALIKYILDIIILDAYNKHTIENIDDYTDLKEEMESISKDILHNLSIVVEL